MIIRTTDIPRPKVNRDSVLALLLSRGIRSGTSSGGSGRWVAGEILKPITVRMYFGPTKYKVARAYLMALTADKLVTYTGRGRHAGWSLTEDGIRAAKDSPPCYAVAEDSR